MNDTLLFFTGVFVFGLMLIGVVLTILEFRQIGKKDERRKRQSPGRNETD